MQAPIIGERSTRASNSSSTVKNFRGERKRDGLFSSTKKDKRIIKHSTLISRIEKSKTPSNKRRRPSKKLVTTLQSLADALPDTTNDSSGITVVGDMKIKHKSLKSRPGAMKKKEMLISMEKERFNKNLAQMAALPAGGNTITNNGAAKGTSSSGNKWAALREFIQQTTEQRPDANPAATRT